MAEHLSADQIRDLRRRALPPGDLLRADQHLSACAECRTRLRETGPPPRFPAFVFESGEPSGHLSYEMLTAYIDNGLDPRVRASVEHHVRSCNSCAGDLRDLQGFAASMAPRQWVVAAAAAAPPVVAKPGLVQRLAAHWQSTAVRVASAGAAAAAIVMAIYMGSSSGPVTNIAQTGGAPTTAPQPGAVSSPAWRGDQTEVRASNGGWVLNDNGQSIVVNPDGSVTGVELPSNARSAILSVTVSGEIITLPRELNRLRGEPGDVQVSLELRPNHEVVEEQPPTVRWRAGSIASPVIHIYDAGGRQVATSGRLPLSASSWSVDRPLEPGQVYTVSVFSAADSRHPVARATFAMVSTSALAELENARHSYPNFHLLQGALLQKAGMLDQAKAEYDKLAQANPQSTLVQRLIANVQAEQRLLGEPR